MNGNILVSIFCFDSFCLVDDRVANDCDVGNKLISVSVIENLVTQGGGGLS